MAFSPIPIPHRLAADLFDMTMSNGHASAPHIRSTEVALHRQQLHSLLPKGSRQNGVNCSNGPGGTGAQCNNCSPNPVTAQMSNSRQAIMNGAVHSPVLRGEQPPRPVHTTVSYRKPPVAPYCTLRTRWKGLKRQKRIEHPAA